MNSKEFEKLNPKRQKYEIYNAQCKFIEKIKKIQPKKHKRRWLITLKSFFHAAVYFQDKGGKK